ncbi:MAG: hypothetical protein ACPHK8_07715, partial [Thermoplasmatota archaeon]
MKWVVALLILVPLAGAAAPVLSWEASVQATDVVAKDGAVTLGDETWYYDTTGSLQRTLPAGQWAGALFANGWHLLDGSTIADETQPSTLHPSGVLSTGNSHRVYDNGAFVREWQSELCTGGALSGTGLRDGAQDVAYNDTVVAYRDGENAWSVALVNVSSAAPHGNGVTVVQTDGRVSHYGAATECNGPPAWTNQELLQPVQKVWFGKNTYLLLAEPLLGSRLAAYSPTGSLLWSTPAIGVTEVVEFDRWVVTAGPQIDFLNPSTGRFEHTVKVKATALAAGDQLYAVGSKLWAYETGLPDFAASLENGEVVVRNLGKVTAAFTHGDTYTLAPGESVRFPAQSMTVDPDNLVEESDETNNQVTLAAESSQTPPATTPDVVVIPGPALLGILILLGYIRTRM